MAPEFGAPPLGNSPLISRRPPTRGFRNFGAFACIARVLERVLALVPLSHLLAWPRAAAKPAIMALASSLSATYQGLMALV